MTNDPVWLAYARRQTGVRETPGPANDSRIMGMARRAARWLGINYTADAVPWCGLFVADCMEAAGFKPPAGFIGVRAKAWASWGTAIGTTATRPPIGSIAVFGRDGGGHVGFVTAIHANGDLDILGGNQGDAVNIRRFSRLRLVALRWPPATALAAVAPWATGATPATTGEA
jgi:uncharacterized protein (TIGR02594 family)